MGAIASQITSLSIVYSIVYSDADQRKHQSSASLAFVRGIQRGPVNSQHKWPVTRKMFPFHDVIMQFREWPCLMVLVITKPSSNLSKLRPCQHVWLKIQRVSRQSEMLYPTYIMFWKRPYFSRFSVLTYGANGLWESLHINVKLNEPTSHFVKKCQSKPQFFSASNMSLCLYMVISGNVQSRGFRIVHPLTWTGSCANTRVSDGLRRHNAHITSL